MLSKNFGIVINGDIHHDAPPYHDAHHNGRFHSISENNSSILDKWFGVNVIGKNMEKYPSPVYQSGFFSSPSSDSQGNEDKLEANIKNVDPIVNNSSVDFRSGVEMVKNVGHDHVGPKDDVVITTRESSLPSNVGTVFKQQPADHQQVVQQENFQNPEPLIIARRQNRAHDNLDDFFTGVQRQMELDMDRMMLNNHEGNGHEEFFFDSTRLPTKFLPAVFPRGGGGGGAVSSGAGVKIAAPSDSIVENMNQFKSAQGEISDKPEQVVSMDNQPKSDEEATFSNLNNSPIEGAVTKTTTESETGGTNDKVSDNIDITTDKNVVDNLVTTTKTASAVGSENIPENITSATTSDDVEKTLSKVTMSKAQESLIPNLRPNVFSSHQSSIVTLSQTPDGTITRSEIIDDGTGKVIRKKTVSRGSMSSGGSRGSDEYSHNSPSYYNNRGFEGFPVDHNSRNIRGVFPESFFEPNWKWERSIFPNFHIGSRVPGMFSSPEYHHDDVHLFWGWCAWWNSVLYACTSINTQFKVSQPEGPHHQNLNQSVTNYTSNNNNFLAAVVGNNNLFSIWSCIYIGIFGMVIPIIGCFSPLFLGKVLGGYRMASFHFVGNEQAQCFFISKKVVKKIYRCWLKENFGDDGKPLLQEKLPASEENASARAMSELPYLVRLLLVKKFGYIQLEKNIEVLNEKMNPSKSHVRDKTMLQKQGETILDCSDNCSKTAPLLSRKQENFTQNNHNKAAAADSASEKVKPTSVWQKTATKNLVDIMLDDYTLVNDSDYTAFPLFADGLDLDLYLRLYTKMYCDVFVNGDPDETNEKSVELKVSKHDDNPDNPDSCYSGQEILNRVENSGDNYIFSGNKNNTAFEELNKDYIFFTLNWLNIVGPLLNTKWDETLSSIVERYRDIVLDTMDVYDWLCESEILSMATKSETRSDVKIRSDDCQPGDFREDKKIRFLSGPADLGRCDESTSEKAEKLNTAISTAAQETTVQQDHQQNEIVTSWIVQSGSSIPKKWTRPATRYVELHQEPVEFLSVISLPIPLFECKKKWNILCNRVTDEDNRPISAPGHVIQFESDRFPWQIMDHEFDGDQAWSKKTMTTTK